MKESDYADNAVIIILVGIGVMMIELLILIFDIIPSILVVYAIFISETLIFIIALIFTLGALLLEKIQRINENDPLYEPSIKIREW